MFFILLQASFQNSLSFPDAGKSRFTSSKGHSAAATSRFRRLSVRQAPPLWRAHSGQFSPSAFQTASPRAFPQERQKVSEGARPGFQPLAEKTPLRRQWVRPVPDEDGGPVKKGDQFITGKSGNKMEAEKPVPFQKRPELFRRRPKGPEIFLHVHRLKIKPSRSFVKIEVSPRERFHPPAEPDSPPPGAGGGNPDRSDALEEEVEGDVPLGTGIPAQDDPRLADGTLGNGVAHGERSLIPSFRRSVSDLRQSERTFTQRSR